MPLDKKNTPNDENRRLEISLYAAMLFSRLHDFQSNQKGLKGHKGNDNFSAVWWSTGDVYGQKAKSKSKGPDSYVWLLRLWIIEG